MRPGLHVYEGTKTPQFNMPILTFSQEDYEFEDSLGYIVRLCPLNLPKPSSSTIPISRAPMWVVPESLHPSFVCVGCLLLGPHPCSSLFSRTMPGQALSSQRHLTAARPEG